MNDIHGTVFKNGSATLLARVVGAAGTAVNRASIQSAKYSIFLIDTTEKDSQTAIAGHTNVTVAKAGLIFDTLQTDAVWDVDSTGYNFKHVLSVTTHQAFATAGENYLIVFTLTPTTGQPILVRFRVTSI